MERKAVILFTRVPVAGSVKTRLQPFLSGKECAALQEAFIKDTYDVLIKLDADILVYYTPESDLSLLKLIIGKDAAYMPQKGACLGGKMQSAISDVLGLGYGLCVLIGSDIPLLTKEDIEEAFDILDSSDIAISPTEDGGYYLIGMKEPCAAAFHVEYGGSTVFENTCAAIRNAGKSCGIGPIALDIDDKHDLYKLNDILKESAAEKCVYTRKVLRHIFDRGGKNEPAGCKLDS